MLDYWTSFARTGRPQAAHAAAWPAYGSAGAYMHFAAAPRPETGLMPGMYALNEEVVCRRNAQGNLPWHWNVGLVSPPLPPAVPRVPLDPVGARDGAEVKGARLQGAREGPAVDRDEAEMHAVARGPFEIVEQRPIEIGMDRDALVETFAARRQAPESMKAMRRRSSSVAIPLSVT